MTPNLKPVKQYLQIGYNPEKTKVVLITNDRQYVWPRDVVPSIVAGLRACADGDPFPEVSKGLVFAVTSKNLISVSDTPAQARYTNDANDEAVMEVEQSRWSYLQPPHRARELANGLEETLRAMAG